MKKIEIKLTNDEMTFLKEYCEFTKKDINGVFKEMIEDAKDFMDLKKAEETFTKDDFLAYEQL